MQQETKWLSFYWKKHE